MSSLTATGVLRQIDSSLTKCAICFESFVDPRSLPCAHTFCLRCLRQYYEQLQIRDNDNTRPNLGSMSCPVCRTSHHFGSVDKLDELPKNLAVAQLLDILKEAPASLHQVPVVQQPQEPNVGPAVVNDLQMALDDETALALALNLSMEEQHAGNRNNVLPNAEQQLDTTIVEEVDLALAIQLSMGDQMTAAVGPITTQHHRPNQQQRTNEAFINDDFALAVQLNEIEEQRAAALYDDSGIDVGAAIVNQPRRSTAIDDDDDFHQNFSTSDDEDDECCLYRLCCCCCCCCCRR